ncbi:MAG TPA: hypothetical protein VM889_14775 [Candidatus Thermoplasmatota archaeon]|nr:hypothetical protein [Candidatus Thermoplasmatota archaeon]
MGVFDKYKLKGKAVDPVCHMEVEKSNPPGGKAVHEGVDHYFCGAPCRAKFVADPQRFLGPGSEGGPHQMGGRP